MWTIWSSLLVPSLLSGAEASVVPQSKFISRLQSVSRNPNYPLDVVDKFEEATMPKVEAYMSERITSGTNNNCTLENAVIRQEWSDLSEEQRQEYVAAVTCLTKLPPKSDKARFPGAMSRYDDFVAFHMTHAMQLHDNYHLFGAHKYYVWLFEKALREECGYTGYQPYMNYDRYSQDPYNSPLLNGNASSLGGNGELEPTYKGVPQPGRTPNIIASGGGGGCVTSGPFSDMVVSLGPTSMSMGSNLPKNPKADGTGPNPRCLRRDVNKNAFMGATADRAFSLLNDNAEMDGFYNQLLGTPPPRNDPYPWGIHTAGHYVAAVDPGGDPNTSPGDPLFYFHHTALDRLWWIWQMQDPGMRLNAIPFVNGSMTMPGHGKRQSKDPNDVIVDLEWLGPPVKLMETHDQLGGNGGLFCYVYV
ncbi:Di-copper centre-containing protein [Hypoxylon fragiforme]|uniref:Di-copper centre-containing protein n=1 Tax=Hypoxylon fragiforme TaxID=63214 RepID=UPI0020C6C169|nr:Di-copper centre-containing protein [Hypoxylon fragiforme]KAI2614782.1 Di-copper centre-containing protein [Hypoxylon fragiforme]